MPVATTTKEGSLEAPTRHALDWQNPDFYDAPKLLAEMQRVFDLCHGCRRCNSLCQAFPTLFDLVDASETLEIDGVDKKDYWQVVDQCYLCDLCYQTKCPYTPPHEWNIDFPHLMLRAKAVKHKQGGASAGEKLLASTDAVGKLAGIPIVVNAVNAANKNKTARKILNASLGVHPEARVPTYYSDTLRKRESRKKAAQGKTAQATPCDKTQGRVALFVTCFGNYNEPGMSEDLIEVFRHNHIEVTLAASEKCCGMPKLELGDLDAVARAKDYNIPQLARAVKANYDIIAPVPSCVLMFRQELPLMFPDDPEVQSVARAMFDPFEYLMLRHKAGLLNTDFKRALGRIAYHVACHQRVQKIGMQTKACLSLAPDTEVRAIERCSGHDGTYGVKTKSYARAKKIAAPVVARVKQFAPDHYASDCPMAARFIEHQIADGTTAAHPISLLRHAYAI